MSKITSWTSTEDGSVVEGDVKFFPNKDGTYELESAKESIGFQLGVDKSTQLNTVIVKIEESRY